MKLFIINLKKNIEKKAKIVNILSEFEAWSKINIDYTFIEAIDD